MFQSFVNLSKLVESLEDETGVFQDLDKCARDISSSKDLRCWWEEKIEVGVMVGGRLGSTAGIGSVLEVCW